MIALARSPAETYRSVDFDARVNGATPAELTDLCFEQLIVSLGRAMHAHAANDPGTRSTALSRAVSCLLALEMGIAGQDGIAATLRELYARARFGARLGPRMGRADAQAHPRRFHRHPRGPAGQSLTRGVRRACSTRS